MIARVPGRAITASTRMSNAMPAIVNPIAAVRCEGRIAPGGQALVLEAEDTQACQEDLGYPEQQESQQQPAVAAEGDTAQPGEGTGRDFLVTGGGRLVTYHLLLAPRPRLRCENVQAQECYVCGDR